MSDDTLEELIVPPQEEGQEARGLTDLYTCGGLCELAAWWNVGIKAGYESLGACRRHNARHCRALRPLTQLSSRPHCPSGSCFCSAQCFSD